MNYFRWWGKYDFPSFEKYDVFVLSHEEAPWVTRIASQEAANSSDSEWDGRQEVSEDTLAFQPKWRDPF